MSNVVKFPEPARLFPKRRSRENVRNGSNMHTFLFRSYDLIVQSDEADLVRDVSFDIDKAQPTTLERRAGTGRRPGAAAHRGGHQADRGDRCCSTLDPGAKMNHETYLGDGLYASWDGYQIRLRAPRDGGDHEVFLEDGLTLQAFFEFLDALPKRGRP
jgi:hypothetical protein